MGLHTEPAKPCAHQRRSGLSRHSAVSACAPCLRWCREHHLSCFRFNVKRCTLVLDSHISQDNAYCCHRATELSKLKVSSGRIGFQAQEDCCHLGVKQCLSCGFEHEVPAFFCTTLCLRHERPVAPVSRKRPTFCLNSLPLQHSV
jgi:hypothetical protein